MSFGLFQYVFDRELGNNPISIRQGLLNATFKDALSFGVFIAVVFPLVIGAFFCFKKKFRFFPIIILILSLFMIFHTGSKSGLICLFLSVGVFFLLSVRLIIKSKKIKILRRKRAAFFSFIAVFLIVSFILSLVLLNENTIQSQTLSRFKNTVKLGIDGFFSSNRMWLWRFSAQMMKDYPLTGVGIGGYIIEVSNYASRYKGHFFVFQSAENYFLQMSSELGLFGLILIIWVFWEIIKQMRKSFLKFPNNDRNKFILIGAMTGVISFMVNIQFHTYIGSYEIKYLFWLLVALVFYLGKREEGQEKKVLFSKNFKILSAVGLLIFSGLHLWNSTHTLSLKSRTEKFGLKQDFGLDKVERTRDGREFRWSKGYGGMTVRIEKPVIEIPLLASHPDIREKPVKVRVYLIKEFFGQKRLLDEIELKESVWRTFTYHVPEEVSREVILLIKVSRTWSPLKVLGTPDPRNLGVAVGKIQFKEIQESS